MRLFDDEYTDLVEEALTRQMYREQDAYFKGLMHWILFSQLIQKIFLNY
nr:hypothetical protein [Mycoplasmopsis bovis]